MLHILWIILKIILSIIGILLAIVLGVLLLILFCPVRYEAQVAKPEAEKVLDAEIKAKVSWLFRAISVRVTCIKRKPEMSVTLFGRSLDKLLGLSKPAGEKEKAAEDKVKKPETAVPEPPALPEQANQIPVLEAEELRKESEKVSAKAEENTEKKAESAGEKEEPAEPGKEAKEQAAPDNLQNEPEKESEVPAQIEETSEKDTDKTETESEPKLSFFEKLEEKTGAFGKKIRSTLEKLQTLMEKAEWWKDFITDERTGFALSCVLRELGKIIRHILPKKFWGHVTYGFEDPSITGRILAFAGMTLPLHKNAVEIDPRFDEEFILDVDVGLKGRLYGIRLAASAVLILINKDVWFVIKTLMHKEG